MDWSGIGVTHLRPTLFLENWLVFAEVVRNQSKLPLAYGQCKSAPLCADDVARLIVSIHKQRERSKKHAAGYSFQVGLVKRP